MILRRIQQHVKGQAIPNGLAVLRPFLQKMSVFLGVFRYSNIGVNQKRQCAIFVD